MKWAFALMALGFLTGCSVERAAAPAGVAAHNAIYKRSPVYTPYDPMSADVLSKTHKGVAAACRAVGSCAYLVIACKNIDGKAEYFASSPSFVGEGSGSSADDASYNMMEYMRTDAANHAWSAAHPQKTTVTTCDGNC
jgi:hypothetical protein